MDDGALETDDAGHHPGERTDFDILSGTDVDESGIILGAHEV
jgi:hypothetical protein